MRAQGPEQSHSPRSLECTQNVTFVVGITVYFLFKGKLRLKKQSGLSQGHTAREPWSTDAF